MKMNSMAVMVWNKYTRPIPVPSSCIIRRPSRASRRKVLLAAANEFQEVFPSLSANGGWWA